MGSAIASAAMIVARPSCHPGYGGMFAYASSRSSSATAAVSARSNASMKRSRTARSCSVGSPAAQSSRRLGSCRRSVARPRCRALLTAATLVSRIAAVSFADHDSTSRRISAARSRGASSWIAIRNAISIVSRVATTSSG